MNKYAYQVAEYQGAEFIRTFYGSMSRTDAQVIAKRATRAHRTEYPHTRIRYKAKRVRFATIGKLQ